MLKLGEGRGLAQEGVYIIRRMDKVHTYFLGSIECPYTTFQL